MSAHTAKAQCCGRLSCACPSLLFLSPALFSPLDDRTACSQVEHRFSSHCELVAGQCLLLCVTMHSSCFSMKRPTRDRPSNTQRSVPARRSQGSVRREPSPVPLNVPGLSMHISFDGQSAVRAHHPAVSPTERRRRHHTLRSIVLRVHRPNLGKCSCHRATRTYSLHTYRLLCLL